MSRLFRNLILVLVVLGMFAAAWIACMYEARTASELLGQEKRHARALADLLSTTLQPELDGVLAASPPQQSAVNALDLRIRTLFDSSAARIELVDQGGLIRYSTEASRIGTQRKPEADIATDSLTQFGPTDDTASAYAAVSASPATEPLGALALDLDISALHAQLADNTRWIAMGVLMEVAILLALLKLAWHHLQGKIEAHEAARLEAQRQLELERQGMEQKIQARTEQLSRSNNRLQAQMMEHERSEQQIRQIAYYDPLTELPNRTLFKTQLERALAEAGRRGSRLAVMFVDLDKFKRINDTFGHNMGDELLRQAALRLAGCIRGEDALSRDAAIGNSVARLGGDEFTLMLHDVGSSYNAATVAQRVIEAFAVPFVLGIYKVHVSASIGIAYYPSDGDTADSLLKNADIAMYHAKDRGRNIFAFYSHSMSEAAHAKLAMESALRRAVERNEFVLHYQSKVDARSRAVVGVEALLRWNEAERGLVMPSQFISLAEETGLIAPITFWVITEACRQAQLWQRAGGLALPVSVNVSIPQFRDGRIVGVVTQALEQSGLDPRLLEIEVTESLLMDDVDGSIAVLDQLKALGVRIAIDDFGTGYSSMSYLKRFSIDTLKIDRSFVAELDQPGSDAAVCSAIIALGKVLGLNVVAEGVERQAQADVLLAKGCNQMQGYLFGQPIAGDAISQLLLPPGVVLGDFGRKTG